MCRTTKYSGIIYKNYTVSKLLNNVTDGTPKSDPTIAKTCRIKTLILEKFKSIFANQYLEPKCTGN